MSSVLEKIIMYVSVLLLWGWGAVVKIKVIPNNRLVKPTFLRYEGEQRENCIVSRLLPNNYFIYIFLLLLLAAFPLPNCLMCEFYGFFGIFLL